MQQLQRTILSLEVAEMVGREHKNVIRDIQVILGQLGELKIEPSSYFIESSYINSQNKTMPCFLLTKQGCELYGNRMTGIDGTAFSVKYINRFNEMEKQQKVNGTMPGEDNDRDHLTLALEASLETRKLALNLQDTVEEIKTEIKELKDTSYITSFQAKQLRAKVGKKVYEALGGEKTNAFKQVRGKTYSACWRELRDEYGISEYRELPRTKFEQAMEFLEIWQPNTSLRLEIERSNKQLKFALGE